MEKQLNVSRPQDKMSTKYPQDRPNEIVEEQTKKIPNLVFLGAAGLSIAGSLTLILTGKEKFANFVGLWAPTIMLLGVYNKIVKLEDEVLRKQDKVLH